MKIAHLKTSKAERKEPIEVSDREEYPSGMAIHADHHALKKIGFGEELPEHGSTHRIEGEMRVEHSSEETGPDGEPQRRVRFQITHLGAEPKEGKKSEKSIRHEIEEAAGEDEKRRSTAKDGGGSAHNKVETTVRGA